MLTLNINGNIRTNTAAGWGADATVYTAKTILVTTDATYGSTDQRKFKIADGTQTWSNLDYFPVSGYDDATSSIQTQINNITAGNVSYPRRANTWYCSALMAFAPGTQAQSRNIIRFTPFIVSETTTFDRLGMEITGAGTAGSVVSLGIYNSSGGLPTTVNTDGGTIAGDSATNQEVIISTTLNAGLYYLAFQHDSVANITFRSIPFAQYLIPAILGVIAGSFTGNQPNHCVMTYTYDGTFPTFTGTVPTGNNIGLLAIKTQ